MKKITIKTIPHNKQRYPTVGDYWDTKDGLEMRVSDMKNPTHELAVILHELIEQHLCRLAGVPFKDIDDFDKAYEKARDSGTAPCGCPIQDEPGNDRCAPYFSQHQFATELERAFLSEASWTIYDKQVNEL